MNAFRHILRSVLHYRFAYLGVLAGAVLGATVLLGEKPRALPWAIDFRPVGASNRCTARAKHRKFARTAAHSGAWRPHWEVFQENARAEMLLVTPKNELPLVAPKGRKLIAQGNALGIHRRGFKSPERAELSVVSSIRRLARLLP